MQQNSTKLQLYDGSVPNVFIGADVWYWSVNLASNINFHSSCSHNVDQIIWLALCRHHDSTIWISNSAVIVLQQKSHCSHMRTRTWTFRRNNHQKTKRDKINILFPTNVTRQKALLAAIITCSPPLTHSGVSQIRHAAVRSYWGQPAQRMKQMKSFRRDVYNPVLTTVLRPPRRL